MTGVWLRARALMTGECWFSLRGDASLASEEPIPQLIELVRALDPETKSVLIARQHDGEWIVAATGFPTAQERTNTPNPTVTLVVVDDERRCRYLAAALIAGKSRAPEESLGAKLGRCINDDGPDTFTPGLDRPTFTRLLEAALGEPPVGLGPAAGQLPLPGGRPLTVEALRDVAAALAGGAPLPPGDVPVIVTGKVRRDALSGRTVGWYVDTQLERGATDGPAAQSHDLRRPARPIWVVSMLFNVAVFVALLFAAGTAVFVARVALDFAQIGRLALGFRAPEVGIDWFLLLVGGILVIVLVVAFIFASRLVRRRYRDRLLDRFGDPDRARLFPVGVQGNNVQGNKLNWLPELLASPKWRPLTEEWRAKGLLAVPASGWADTHYKQAAKLVREELNKRVGSIALATGLAVAVAQRRTLDAVAVLAGSAELQFEALASLGLRPTPRAWLQLARTAATGLLVSTFIDVEERLETRFVIRAAAYGLDVAGEFVEDLGDAVGSDDLTDAFGEALEGGGGFLSSALAPAGLFLGVTGNVIRQVSDFIREIGDDITEGVIVASLLHYHGMSLVADALALDEEHRAELAPRAGKVPAELKDSAMRFARRATANFRAMAKKRVIASTKKATDFVSKPFLGSGGPSG